MGRATTTVAAAARHETRSVVVVAWATSDQSALDSPRRSQWRRLHAGTPRLTATTPPTPATAGQRHGPSATGAARRGAPDPTLAWRLPRRVLASTATTTSVSATRTHPSRAAGVRSNDARYEV